MPALRSKTSSDNIVRGIVLLNLFQQSFMGLIFAKAVVKCRKMFLFEKLIVLALTSFQNKFAYEYIALCFF